MLREVENALKASIGEAFVPSEYVLFQFCREFGCLPEDLDDMPSSTLELWIGFLRAEGKAAKIRSLRASHGRP